MKPYSVATLALLVVQPGALGCGGTTSSTGADASVTDGGATEAAGDATAAADVTIDCPGMLPPPLSCGGPCPADSFFCVSVSDAALDPEAAANPHCGHSDLCCGQAPACLGCQGSCDCVLQHGYGDCTCEPINGMAVKVTCPP